MDNEDSSVGIDPSLTVTIDTSDYEDFKDWGPTIIVPNTNVDYKFNEGALIDEFKTYIDSTYDAHYAKDKFQSTEFMVDGGLGTGFCMGNVLKYAQRYGKKGTHSDARKDLLKIVHYAIIALHNHDEENK